MSHTRNDNMKGTTEKERQRKANNTVKEIDARKIATLRRGYHHRPSQPLRLR